MIGTKMEKKNYVGEFEDGESFLLRLENPRVGRKSWIVTIGGKEYFALALIGKTKTRLTRRMTSAKFFPERKILYSEEYYWNPKGIPEEKKHISRKVKVITKPNISPA